MEYLRDYLADQMAGMPVACYSGAGGAWRGCKRPMGTLLERGGLASISTRNNSVNTIGVFGGSATTQANWMISFLSPNQGIGVG